MHDKWPDEVLAEMVLDQDTALVTLTHDPKIDDAALHWGLPNRYFISRVLAAEKPMRRALIGWPRLGLTMRRPAAFMARGSRYWGENASRNCGVSCR